MVQVLRQAERTDVWAGGRGWLRRFVVAALIVTSLAAAGLVAGVAPASAATTRYFSCPVTVPGAGCGITGTVGAGKYLAEFKYATSSGYEFEPFVDQCETVCPVFHWAVGREDRTPAGFQVTSDGAFTLDRMLS